MTTAFPDHLDWSAQYLIPTPDKANDLSAFRPSWLTALLYDTNDVREFVTNGGLYHQSVSDHFLIAYNFTFEVDAAGDVVAHGVTHPATQVRDDYHTDESQILASTNITIRQQDPQTALALRRYVRQHHLQQLPDTLYGFPQPADQSCRNCRQQDAGAGATPVLQCPDCERYFCPNCARIDFQPAAAALPCPHCGYTPPDAR